MVAIHGFATGYPFMDFIGMHARYLHQELGLNVVLPVLPLHGPRKITRISGEAFLSFDLVNTVHGLTQAVWDVRRVLSWLTTQEPTAVALYGVSLGGYIASLLTGLVDGIDAVVAGIPVVDFLSCSPTRAPTMCVCGRSSMRFSTAMPRPCTAWSRPWSSPPCPVRSAVHLRRSR